ncbi:hypothetical protein EB796_005322 [Bugula neritina]|uniref:SWIM-type domain-containing protein n=1 Tax=Bugula neritina TaxID=10212 RepID=A0A7J7KDL7_BUGNE|nr:hypothetical protein EB796_005322 [Bugula neritina]
MEAQSKREYLDLLKINDSTVILDPLLLKIGVKKETVFQCGQKYYLNHCNPHSVWIACLQITGKILSAWCSCTAGLSSSCNHIAAVVFKLDYISQKEPFKRSCTDGECNWKRSTKSVCTPRRLADLQFFKPDYKKGKDRNYARMHRKVATSSNGGVIFKEWEEELKVFASESTYIIEKYGKKPNLEEWQKVQETTLLKDVEPFKNLIMSTLAENADSQEHFSTLVRTMSITRNQVWEIEAATVKQSDSPLWKLLRHGRITASNFYRVKTRMESKLRTHVLT